MSIYQSNKIFNHSSAYYIQLLSHVWLLVTPWDCSHAKLPVHYLRVWSSPGVYLDILKVLFQAKKEQKLLK